MESFRTNRNMAFGFIHSVIPIHSGSKGLNVGQNTSSRRFQRDVVARRRLRREGCILICNASAGQDNSANQKPNKRDLKPAVKELRSVLKKCSIYLVGPMGSGKSVLGKYLAYELGFRFLDTDDIIQTAAGKPIPKIFEEDGEEAFRDLESAVLDQVQPFIGCCVATGGGAVLRTTNWGKLQTGIVVFLDVAEDLLVERLRGDTNRPLLANAEDLAERVSSILNERRSLYEQADVIVSITENEPLDDLGNEVIRRLTNFIKANPPRLSKLYPAGLNKD